MTDCANWYCELLQGPFFQWLATLDPRGWMTRAHCIMFDPATAIRTHLGDAAQAGFYGLMAHHFFMTSTAKAVAVAIAAYLAMCGATHVLNSAMFYWAGYDVASWVNLLAGVVALVAGVYVKRFNLVIRSEPKTR